MGWCTENDAAPNRHKPNFRPVSKRGVACNAQMRGKRYFGWDSETEQIALITSAFCFAYWRVLVEFFEFWKIDGVSIRSPGFSCTSSDGFARILITSTIITWLSRSNRTFRPSANVENPPAALIALRIVRSGVNGTRCGALTSPPTFTKRDCACMVITTSGFV